jgi:hypothetical protein
MKVGKREKWFHLFAFFMGGNDLLPSGSLIVPTLA